MADSPQLAQAEHAGCFKSGVAQDLRHLPDQRHTATVSLETVSPALRSLGRSPAADDSAEVQCASCHTGCCICPSGVFLNPRGPFQLVGSLRAPSLKIWFKDLGATSASALLSTP